MVTAGQRIRVLSPADLMLLAITVVEGSKAVSEAQVITQTVCTLKLGLNGTISVQTPFV